VGEYKRRPIVPCGEYKVGLPIEESDRCIYKHKKVRISYVRQPKYLKLIMIKNNRLCIGLYYDLLSYDDLQTMIGSYAHSIVVVARLLYVFVYSLSFCTSCTISKMN